MKERKFTLALRDEDGVECSGFEFEVQGVPLVVHYVYSGYGVFGPGWRVSEPITGRSIPTTDDNTLQGAIDNATKMVERNSSADKLLWAIRQHQAAQEGGT